MFGIDIPKRTLLMMGPQRCGKTTAMLEYLKMNIRENRRIMLIGEPDEARTYLSMADVEGTPPNVVILSVASRVAVFTMPAMYDVVFLIGSSVFIRPGRVQLYHKPSEQVCDFLRRVRDDHDLLPYVVCETHYEGTERDVGEKEN